MLQKHRNLYLDNSKITILIAFFLHLFICAFQIYNYLKTTNLLYSFIEAKSIVISIVEERLCLIVIRKSTS
jgi:hypothetical protein